VKFEVAGVGEENAMAKRIAKAESGLLALLVIVALPIFLVVKFFETFGFLVPIIGITGIVVVVCALRTSSRTKRVSMLTAKYGDSQVVERIVNRTIWVGETSEQLVESLGCPADIDEKVLKTKKKAVWKYAHKGGNRYGLRITIENDLVAGWDEKL
jgi:hypothetical protein